MKDFLISYNKMDRQWAEWIAWELEAVGSSVVIQAWDFRPGSNFVLEMQMAAQDATRTIAVLSPDYLGALYTQPEWAAALSQDPLGKEGKLVCVLVRNAELKGLLKQIIYIDLLGLDEDAARRELLSGLDRGRAKPIVAPLFPASLVHHDLERKPYPGNLANERAEAGEYESFVPDKIIEGLSLEISRPGDELRSLISKAKDPEEHNKNEYDGAVNAIFAAIYEEKIYLRKLSNGSPPSISDEEGLSRLWFKAWKQLRKFHDNIAHLCLVRGYCWNDERLRIDAKYSDLLVDIDSIFDEMRLLLGKQER